MPVSPSMLSDLSIQSKLGIPSQHLDSFQNWCRRAEARFGAHPNLPKISRKELKTPFQDMSTFGWSVLNTGKDGIYVFFPEPVGKGSYGTVKYALRIDAEATSPAANQLWTVKTQLWTPTIKALESVKVWSNGNPVPEAIDAEAKVGLRMGFFTQALFIRVRNIKQCDYKYYLIGPYKGISLMRWLQTEPTSDQRLQVAFTLCQQLHDMHKNKRISHGDIKAANILINHVTLEVTLADFGFSTLLDSESKQKQKFKGTPFYLPLMNLEDNIIQLYAEAKAWTDFPNHREQLDWFALRRVFKMPFDREDAPPSLFDEKILIDLPTGLITALITAPRTEERFLSTTCTPYDFAQSLLSHRRVQCALPVSIKHQSLEWLSEYLIDERFKTDFNIENLENFLKTCHLACNYFEDHPGDQKLGRKFVGYSFLNIDQAVYLIRRHADEKRENGYVKRAVRIDRKDERVFRVYIQCVPHPLEKKRKVVLDNALSIGRKVGFFEQKERFIRRAKTYDKVYFIAPDRGISLVHRGMLDRQTGLRIAFNLCMAIHQMHAGDEGTKRPPVVHGDLRPSHILVDADDHVTVMSFGLASLKITSKITEYGSKWYLPMEKSDDKQMLEQANLAIARIQNMKRVDLDSFALKRILKMPYSFTVDPATVDQSLEEHFSLLDDATFNHLPEALRVMIDTANPEAVYQRKDTPLEMAARLALFMFNIETPPHMSVELQKRLVSVAQLGCSSKLQEELNGMTNGQELLARVLAEMTPKPQAKNKSKQRPPPIQLPTP